MARVEAVAEVLDLNVEVVRLLILVSASATDGLVLALVVGLAPASKMIINFLVILGLFLELLQPSTGSLVGGFRPCTRPNESSYS